MLPDFKIRKVLVKLCLAPFLLIFFSSLLLCSSSLAASHLVFVASHWARHSATPGMQNVFISTAFQLLGLWQFCSNLSETKMNFGLWEEPGEQESFHSRWCFLGSPLFLPHNSCSVVRWADDLSYSVRRLPRTHYMKEVNCVGTTI